MVQANRVVELHASSSVQSRAVGKACTRSEPQSTSSPSTLNHDFGLNFGSHRRPLPKNRLDVSRDVAPCVEGLLIFQLHGERSVRIVARRGTCPHFPQHDPGVLPSRRYRVPLVLDLRYGGLRCGAAVVIAHDSRYHSIVHKLEVVARIVTA